jgi:hypothetical protein
MIASSCAVYHDRASHLFATPAAGRPVSHERLIQVGWALKALGIDTISTSTVEL